MPKHRQSPGLRCKCTVFSGTRILLVVLPCCDTESIHGLSFDYGWRVVEEYQLNLGTPAASSRAIAAHFRAQGVKMSASFVLSTMRRWWRCGDPTELRTGGCTARRANDAEWRWMK